jgi:hypothetical protein
VFEGLCIFKTSSCPEVNQEELALFLCSSEYEVARVKLVVNEILEVEILQNRDNFLSEHECGLGRETPLRETHQGLQGAIELFEDDKVIVFFLATPMHVGDPRTSLHNLKYLAFL